MDNSMTLEDAQRILEEELLVQERRIMELKTRHNSYARACRLPPELLLEIFMFLRVPFELQEWHGVTHVCRYWRHVALEAPTLWTTPSPHPRDCTLLMLERSQLADINIQITKKTCHSAVTAIVEHATRIKTLRVSLDTRDLTYAQKSLLVSGLSANSFRQSPSLKRLEIYGLDVINRDLFPFPNLTHLRLFTKASASVISIEELCHILAEMTALQDLSLNIKFMASSPNHLPKIVRLPHLEALSIQNARPPNPAQIRALLNWMSLPSLQRLDIGAAPEQVPDNDDPTAIAISTTLKNGNFEILDTLIISSLIIFFYSKHIGLKRHYLRAHLSHSITTRDSKPILIGLISLAATEYSHLCLTCVHLATDLRPDKFVQLLGTLPLLESIKISRFEMIKALPAALNKTVSYALGPSVACPRLHSITFCSFDWEPDGFSVLTDLCNALSQRYRSGSGVKRLCLLDCRGFPDSSIATLGAIGVYVYASDDLLDSAWLGDAAPRATDSWK